MTNEELIYQITKAVYQRLGPAVDKDAVESLVADIYRLVRSGNAAPAAPVEARQGREPRVVISAFGISRPGIVAAIAATLAETDYDIVDMNQTVVQGKFAMVLIAEANRASSDVTTLKARLKEAGKRVGVRVYAQREDLFQAMHRV
jgi:ACT domain-containing protein